LTGFLAAGALFAAFALFASAETWERLVSLGNSSEDYNYTSRDGRIEVWKRGVGYMVQNPVLGVGADAFFVADGTISGKENLGFGIKYSAAHNSVVQVGRSSA